MRRWILTLFEPSTARPVRILRQVVVDKGASLTLGRMADVQLSQSNHNVSRKHVHVSADANNALTVECLSRNNVYLFELNRSEATVSLKRGQSHTFSPSLHLQPEFRFEYQGLTQVVQIRFTNAKFDASNGAAASDAMEGGTLDTCLDEDTNSLNNTTNNENSSITNNSYNNTNNNGDNNDSTDSNNNSSSKQSNDGTTNVSKSIDKADAADSGDDLFDALFGSKDDESETEEKPASMGLEAMSDEEGEVADVSDAFVEIKEEKDDQQPAAVFAEDSNVGLREEDVPVEPLEESDGWRTVQPHMEAEDIATEVADVVEITAVHVGNDSADQTNPHVLRDHFFLKFFQTRKVKLVETRSSAHETGLSAEDYLQLQEKLAREEELEKKRKKAFEAEVEFKSSTKATLEKQRKKREQALSDVLSAPAKPPIKPPAKPSTAKRLRSRRKQGRPVAEVQEKRVVEEPHEETKEETPMKERPVNDFDDLLDLSDEEPPKKRRRMVQQDSLSMEMSMEVGIDNADPCESLPQSMEIVLDAPAKVLAANKVAPRTGDSESEDVDILDLL